MLWQKSTNQQFEGVFPLKFSGKDTHSKHVLEQINKRNRAFQRGNRIIDTPTLDVHFKKKMNNFQPVFNEMLKRGETLDPSKEGVKDFQNQHMFLREAQQSFPEGKEFRGQITNQPGSLGRSWYFLTSKNNFSDLKFNCETLFQTNLNRGKREVLPLLKGVSPLSFSFFKLDHFPKKLEKFDSNFISSSINQQCTLLKNLNVFNKNKLVTFSNQNISTLPPEVQNKSSREVNSQKKGKKPLFGFSDSTFFSHPPGEKLEKTKCSESTYHSHHCANNTNQCVINTFTLPFGQRIISKGEIFVEKEKNESSFVFFPIEEAKPLLLCPSSKEKFSFNFLTQNDKSMCFQHVHFARKEKDSLPLSLTFKGQKQVENTSLKGVRRFFSFNSLIFFQNWFEGGPNFPKVNPRESYFEKKQLKKGEAPLGCYADQLISNYPPIESLSNSPKSNVQPSSKKKVLGSSKSHQVYRQAPERIFFPSGVEPSGVLWNKFKNEPSYLIQKVWLQKNIFNSEFKKILYQFHAFGLLNLPIEFYQKFHFNLKSLIQLKKKPYQNAFLKKANSADLFDSLQSLRHSPTNALKRGVNSSPNPPSGGITPPAGDLTTHKSPFLGGAFGIFAKPTSPKKNFSRGGVRVLVESFSELNGRSDDLTLIKKHAALILKKFKWIEFNSFASRSKISNLSDQCLLKSRLMSDFKYPDLNHTNTQKCSGIIATLIRFILLKTDEQASTFSLLSFSSRTFIANPFFLKIEFPLNYFFDREAPKEPGFSFNKKFQQKFFSSFFLPSQLVQRGQSSLCALPFRGQEKNFNDSNFWPPTRRGKAPSRLGAKPSWPSLPSRGDSFPEGQINSSISPEAKQPPDGAKPLEGLFPDEGFGGFGGAVDTSGNCFVKLTKATPAKGDVKFFQTFFKTSSQDQVSGIKVEGPQISSLCCKNISNPAFILNFSFNRGGFFEAPSTKGATTPWTFSPSEYFSKVQQAQVGGLLHFQGESPQEPKGPITPGGGLIGERISHDFNKEAVQQRKNCFKQKSSFLPSPSFHSGGVRIFFGEKNRPFGAMLRYQNLYLENINENEFHFRTKDIEQNCFEKLLKIPSICLDTRNNDISAKHQPWLYKWINMFYFNENSLLDQNKMFFGTQKGNSDKSLFPDVSTSPLPGPSGASRARRARKRGIGGQVNTVATSESLKCRDIYTSNIKTDYLRKDSILKEKEYYQIPFLLNSRGQSSFPGRGKDHTAGGVKRNSKNQRSYFSSGVSGQGDVVETDSNRGEIPFISIFSTKKTKPFLDQQRKCSSPYYFSVPLKHCFFPGCLPMKSLIVQTCFSPSLTFFGNVFNQKPPYQNEKESLNPSSKADAFSKINPRVQNSFNASDKPPQTPFGGLTTSSGDLSTPSGGLTIPFEDLFGGYSFFGGDCCLSLAQVRGSTPEASFLFLLKIPNQYFYDFPKNQTSQSFLGFQSYLTGIYKWYVSIFNFAQFPSILTKTSFGRSPLKGLRTEGDLFGRNVNTLGEGNNTRKGGVVAHRNLSEFPLRYEHQPWQDNDQRNFFLYQLYEPCTFVSWGLLQQFWIAFLSFKILADFYRFYGQELFSFVLEFMSQSDVVDENLKQSLLLNDRDAGSRIIFNFQKRFYNLVGIKSILANICEIVWLMQNSQYQPWHNWLNKLSNGILLIGPPGTGKTLMVQAIAGEAKIPILIQSGSLLAKQGVGIEQLKSIFEQAQQIAPCIIFIDEIDTLTKKRQTVLSSFDQQSMGTFETKTLYQWPSKQSISSQNNVINSNITNTKREFSIINENSLSGGKPTNDRFPPSGREPSLFDLRSKTVDQILIESELRRSQLRILTQFLIEMDGIKSRKGIFVIGATNRPESLDLAITRPGRFEKIFYLGLPAKQKRIDILKFYTQNFGISFTSMFQRFCTIASLQFKTKKFQTNLKHFYKYFDYEITQTNTPLGELNSAKNLPSGGLMNHDFFLDPRLDSSRGLLNPRFNSRFNFRPSKPSRRELSNSQKELSNSRCIDIPLKGGDREFGSFLRRGFLGKESSFGLTSEEEQSQNIIAQSWQVLCGHCNANSLLNYKQLLRNCFYNVVALRMLTTNAKEGKTKRNVEHKAPTGQSPSKGFATQTNFYRSNFLTVKVQKIVRNEIKMPLKMLYGASPLSTCFSPQFVFSPSGKVLSLPEKVEEISPPRKSIPLNEMKRGWNNETKINNKQRFDGIKVKWPKPKKIEDSTLTSNFKGAKPTPGRERNPLGYPPLRRGKGSFSQNGGVQPPSEVLGKGLPEIPQNKMRGGLGGELSNKGSEAPLPSVCYRAKAHWWHRSQIFLVKFSQLSTEIHVTADPSLKPTPLLPLKPPFGDLIEGKEMISKGGAFGTFNISFPGGFFKQCDQQNDMVRENVNRSLHYEQSEAPLDILPRWSRQVFQILPQGRKTWKKESFDPYDIDQFERGFAPLCFDLSIWLYLSHRTQGFSSAELAAIIHKSSLKIILDNFFIFEHISLGRRGKALSFASQDQLPSSVLSLNCCLSHNFCVSRSSNLFCSHCNQSNPLFSIIKPAMRCLQFNFKLRSKPLMTSLSGISPPCGSGLYEFSNFFKLANKSSIIHPVKHSNKVSGSRGIDTTKVSRTSPSTAFCPPPERDLKEISCSTPRSDISIQRNDHNMNRAFECNIIKKRTLPIPPEGGDVDRKVKASPEGLRPPTSGAWNRNRAKFDFLSLPIRIVQLKVSRCSFLPSFLFFSKNQQPRFTNLPNLPSSEKNLEDLSKAKINTHVKEVSDLQRSPCVSTYPSKQSNQGGCGTGQSPSRGFAPKRSNLPSGGSGNSGSSGRVEGTLQKEISYASFSSWEVGLVSFAEASPPLFTSRVLKNLENKIFLTMQHLLTLPPSRKKSPPEAKQPGWVWHEAKPFEGLCPDAQLPPDAKQPPEGGFGGDVQGSFAPWASPPRSFTKYSSKSSFPKPLLEGQSGRCCAPLKNGKKIIGDFQKGRRFFQVPLLNLSKRTGEAGTVSKFTTPTWNIRIIKKLVSPVLKGLTTKTSSYKKDKYLSLTPSSNSFQKKHTLSTIEQAVLSLNKREYQNFSIYQLIKKEFFTTILFTSNFVLSSQYYNHLFNPPKGGVNKEGFAPFVDFLINYQAKIAQESTPFVCPEGNEAPFSLDLQKSQHLRPRNKSTFSEFRDEFWSIDSTQMTWPFSGQFNVKGVSPPRNEIHSQKYFSNQNISTLEKSSFWFFCSKSHFKRSNKVQSPSKRVGEFPTLLAFPPEGGNEIYLLYKQLRKKIGRFLLFKKMLSFRMNSRLLSNSAEKVWRLETHNKQFVSGTNLKAFESQQSCFPLGESTLLNSPQKTRQGFWGGWKNVGERKSSQLPSDEIRKNVILSQKESPFSLRAAENITPENPRIKPKPDLFDDINKFLKQSLWLFFQLVSEKSYFCELKIQLVFLNKTLEESFNWLNHSKSGTKPSWPSPLWEGSSSLQLNPVRFSSKPPIKSLSIKSPIQRGLINYTKRAKTPLKTNQTTDLSTSPPSGGIGGFSSCGGNSTEVSGVFPRAGAVKKELSNFENFQRVPKGFQNLEIQLYSSKMQYGETLKLRYFSDALSIYTHLPFLNQNRNCNNIFFLPEKMPEEFLMKQQLNKPNLCQKPSGKSLAWGFASKGFDFPTSAKSSSIQGCTTNYYPFETLTFEKHQQFCSEGCSTLAKVAFRDNETSERSPLRGASTRCRLIVQRKPLRNCFGLFKILTKSLNFKIKYWNKAPFRGLLHDFEKVSSLEPLDSYLPTKGKLFSSLNSSQSPPLRGGETPFGGVCRNVELNPGAIRKDASMKPFLSSCFQKGSKEIHQRNSINSVQFRKVELTKVALNTLRLYIIHYSKVTIKINPILNFYLTNLNPVNFFVYFQKAKPFDILPSVKNTPTLKEKWRRYYANSSFIYENSFGPFDSRPPKKGKWNSLIPHGRGEAPSKAGLKLSWTSPPKVGLKGSLMVKHKLTHTQNPLRGVHLNKKKYLNQLAYYQSSKVIINILLSTFFSTKNNQKTNNSGEVALNIPSSGGLQKWPNHLTYPRETSEGKNLTFDQSSIRQILCYANQKNQHLPHWQERSSLKYDYEKLCSSLLHSNIWPSFDLRPEGSMKKPYRKFEWQSLLIEFLAGKAGELFLIQNTLSLSTPKRNPKAPFAGAAFGKIYSFAQRSKVQCVCKIRPIKLGLPPSRFLYCEKGRPKKGLLTYRVDPSWQTRSKTTILTSISSLGFKEMNFVKFLLQSMIGQSYFYAKMFSIQKHLTLLENRNRIELMKDHFNIFLQTLSKNLQYPHFLKKKSKTTSWNQTNILNTIFQSKSSKQIANTEFNYLDWYRIFISDPDEIELNQEWLAPDKFYHENFFHSKKRFMKGALLPILFIKEKKKMVRSHEEGFAPLIHYKTPQHSQSKFDREAMMASPLARFSSFNLPSRGNLESKAGKADNLFLSPSAKMKGALPPQISLVARENSIPWNHFFKRDREAFQQNILLICFNEAFELILANRELLDYIADCLIRFETIREPEMELLMSQTLLFLFVSSLYFRLK
uniref:Cell division protein FtsH-like protease n=1 Tax=Acetabularia acetabulum TaxID=35845 RepID=W6MCH3_ACEAT|nr:cell division protein FtsH-like protease [Acetabularia acetabulum]